jgi:hypothetical protein
MKIANTITSKILLTLALLSTFPLTHATDGYGVEGSSRPLRCDEDPSFLQEYTDSDRNSLADDSYEDNCMLIESTWMSDPCLSDIWSINNQLGYKDSSLSEDLMNTSYTSATESPLKLSLENRDLEDDCGESKGVAALIQMSHSKGDESPLNSSLESCNSEDDRETIILFLENRGSQRYLIEEDEIDFPQVDSNNEYFFELITSKLNYSYGEDVDFNHLANYYSSPNMALERDNTVYSFFLGYYCTGNPISYSNIGGVTAQISDRQGKILEFETHSWGREAIFPFFKYGTHKEGILTLKKNMFPLDITINHLDSRQHRYAIRDAIENDSRKTLIKWLRKWKQSCSFLLTKEDLFDEKGRQKTSAIIVSCDEPASLRTTLSLGNIFSKND